LALKEKYSTIEILSLLGCYVRLTVTDVWAQLTGPFLKDDVVQEEEEEDLCLERQMPQ